MVEGQQFKVSDNVEAGKDKASEGWQQRELAQQSQDTKGLSTKGTPPEAPGAVGKDAAGNVTHLDMSAGDPFNKKGTDANTNAGKDANKNAGKDPKADSPNVTPPPQDGGTDKNPGTTKGPENAPTGGGKDKNPQTQPSEKQPTQPGASDKAPSHDKHPSDAPTKAPQPSPPPDTKPADKPDSTPQHHQHPGSAHTKPRV